MSPFRTLVVMERFFLLAGRQFLNLGALISVDNADYRIVGQFTVFVKTDSRVLLTANYN